MENIRVRDEELKELDFIKSRVCPFAIRIGVESSQGELFSYQLPQLSRNRGLTHLRLVHPLR